MKFKGTHIDQASGSLAGVTYSHNRGGQYVRARSIPVNPNTPYQQAVRTLMQSLSNYWVNTLTPTQRAAWDEYAAAVPITDTLGDPRNVGGIGMFNRTNIAAGQNGQTVIAAAPTINDLGSFTPFGAFTITGATAATIAFTNTDAWAIAAGGFAFIYCSRPQNPSINFFKGPYRLAGKITGAASPPTSPATITLPFSVATGQQVFGYYRVMQVDGRLSDKVTFLDTR